MHNSLLVKGVIEQITSYNKVSVYHHYCNDIQTTLWGSGMKVHVSTLV